MFFNESSQHHKQHIHVRYNEYEIVYDFKANILEGNLPNKQKKLVEAWIMIHQEDLQSLWQFMKEKGEIFKIEPLK